LVGRAGRFPGTSRPASLTHRCTGRPARRRWARQRRLWGAECCGARVLDRAQAVRWAVGGLSRRATLNAAPDGESCPKTAKDSGRHQPQSSTAAHGRSTVALRGAGGRVQLRDQFALGMQTMQTTGGHGRASGNMLEWPWPARAAHHGCCSAGCHATAILGRDRRRSRPPKTAKTEARPQSCLDRRSPRRPPVCARCALAPGGEMPSIPS
jgi:hypothetical protein